jgi:hypothetical protein
MIKVIKPGQKEFKGFCDRCGCEFTYEFEDISISGVVECPTCGQPYYHPSRGLTPPPNTGWPWPNIGEPIPCNTPSDTALHPCSNCDWWKKMQQPGFIYVGDSPCTWCSKGPYKVTCGTAATVKINDNSNTTGTLQLNPEDLKKYNLNIYGYQPTSGDNTPPVPPKSGSNAVKRCNSCQKDTKCNGNKSCKTK